MLLKMNGHEGTQNIKIYHPNTVYQKFTNMKSNTSDSIIILPDALKPL